MKILPELRKSYSELKTKNSIDIEFDSVIKYAEKITKFLEKIIDEKNNCSEIIINDNFSNACKASEKGITNEMHRSAIEIISKYWVYGKYTHKYKF